MGLRRTGEGCGDAGVTAWTVSVAVTSRTGVEGVGRVWVGFRRARRAAGAARAPRPADTWVEQLSSGGVQSATSREPLRANYWSCSPPLLLRERPVSATTSATWPGSSCRRSGSVRPAGDLRGGSRRCGRGEGAPRVSPVGGGAAVQLLRPDGEAIRGCRRRGEGADRVGARFSTTAARCIADDQPTAPVDVERVPPLPTPADSAPMGVARPRVMPRPGRGQAESSGVGKANRRGLCPRGRVGIPYPFGGIAGQHGVGELDDRLGDSMELRRQVVADVTSPPRFPFRLG
jgi:hypothetical protein